MLEVGGTMVCKAKDRMKNVYVSAMTMIIKILINQVTSVGLLQVHQLHEKHHHPPVKKVTCIFAIGGAKTVARRY